MKKNKKLSIIIVITLIALLAYLGYIKYESRLGTFNDELTTIVKGVDLSPEDLITNLKDGTSVEYKLDEENSKIIITLTNGADIKTIEKQITILEPLGKIKEDAIVNLYDGYKIEDLVTLDNEVKISDYNLNESTGELNVTLSKEDRVETYNKTIKVEQPLVTNISENISIDLSKSYDINDYLNLEDGSEIQTEIDKDNQKIIITATKDNKTETYEVPAEITYSDPVCAEGGFPVKWESYSYDYKSAVTPTFHKNWVGEFYEFYGDGTGAHIIPKIGCNDKFYYTDGLITWPAPWGDSSYNEYVSYDSETETLYIKDNYNNTLYLRKVN